MKVMIRRLHYLVFEAILVISFINLVDAKNLDPLVKRKSTEIIAILNDHGIDGIMEYLDGQMNSELTKDTLTYKALVNVATNLYQDGKRQMAIEILERSKPSFPGMEGLFSVLGQFYWYEDETTRSKENFEEALKINSSNKTARRFMDLFLFVPPDFEVPQVLSTANLKVRAIRISDLNLDYIAVMNNREHIRGVFGPDDDWPQDDLSLEDDRRALANHEKEHRLRSAFTYTVLNVDETECLGCVYILPIHSDKYDAQVFFWVTRKAQTMGLETELNDALHLWLKEKWPFTEIIFPGRSMDWESYNNLEKY